MKTSAGMSLLLLIACGIAVPTVGIAKSLDIKTKLPDAVEKTYRAEFPNGEITKLDVTKENGVMVYDIEFDDGETEKETDIAEDGTMLEFTLVITEKQVPAPAMRTMRKAAAEGKAKMGRVEKIEMNYDTKDGQVVKLDKTVIKYAVELSRKKLTTEIMTTPEGDVLEAPNWNPPK